MLAQAIVEQGCRERQEDPIDGMKVAVVEPGELPPPAAGAVALGVSATAAFVVELGVDGSEVGGDFGGAPFRECACCDESAADRDERSRCQFCSQSVSAPGSFSASRPRSESTMISERLPLRGLIFTRLRSASLVIWLLTHLRLRCLVSRSERRPSRIVLGVALGEIVEVLVAPVPQHEAGLALACVPGSSRLSRGHAVTGKLTVTRSDWPSAPTAARPAGPRPGRRSARCRAAFGSKRPHQGEGERSRRRSER